MKRPPQAGLWEILGSRSLEPWLRARVARSGHRSCRHSPDPPLGPGLPHQSCDQHPGAQPAETRTRLQKAGPRSLRRRSRVRARPQAHAPLGTTHRVAWCGMGCAYRRPKAFLVHQPAHRPIRWSRWGTPPRGHKTQPPCKGCQRKVHRWRAEYAGTSKRAHRRRRGRERRYVGQGTKGCPPKARRDSDRTPSASQPRPGHPSRVALVQDKPVPTSLPARPTHPQRNPASRRPRVAVTSTPAASS